MDDLLLFLCHGCYVVPFSIISRINYVDFGVDDVCGYRALNVFIIAKQLDWHSSSLTV